VLLVVAAFSRHEDLLRRARENLINRFGPAADLEFTYPFNHTRYYEPEMGSALTKRLTVFQNPVAADALADIKLWTNKLEREMAGGGCAETRPINLDPGILTMGKFLLATTKDQAHRIYLRDGIFAEVTLRFEDHHFEPWPWTYADYRMPELREFLTQARAFYRKRLQEIQQSAEQ
jgi:hypothetical protein